jgi:hypothetical protein
VKLKLARHFSQFGRAGWVENDLKLHPQNLRFKVQSSRFKVQPGLDEATPAKAKASEKAVAQEDRAMLTA